MNNILSNFNILPSPLSFNKSSALILLLNINKIYMKNFNMIYNNITKNKIK